MLRQPRGYDENEAQLVPSVVMTMTRPAFLPRLGFRRRTPPASYRLHVSRHRHHNLARFDQRKHAAGEGALDGTSQTLGTKHAAHGAMIGGAPRRHVLASTPRCPKSGQQPSGRAQKDARHEGA